MKEKAFASVKILLPEVTVCRFKYYTLQDKTMWYAITEFLWGSLESSPKTRSSAKIEEGWVLVNAHKKQDQVGVV